MILCDTCSNEFKTIQGLRGHEQMGCPENFARAEDDAQHAELLTTVAELNAELSRYRAKGHNQEQEIRDLKAQLQEGFPTCPKCNLPRSRHFGHVNDLPWKYACPSSPHPATTRQPTTSFISTVTGKPNSEITTEIARLAATHQTATIGPGRDNDHRNTSTFGANGTTRHYPVFSSGPPHAYVLPGGGRRRRFPVITPLGA